MRKIIFSLVLFISLSSIANSQNYPFPRNEIYPFGIMPTNRNHVDVDTVFQNWKSNHVTSQGAGGFRRVLWDTLKATVSEGIGYGMLIAVNVGDKDLFDDLWGYYNLHLDPNGLMKWLRDSLGNDLIINGITITAGSATDAEEDVAYALILAERQWGSSGSINYIQEANDLINKIYQFEIDTTYYLPKSGDEPGGIYRVNISYFAPAYYRAFREVTGNPGWDSVTAACYNFLFFRGDPNTGLVPDWCLPNGDPMPPCPPLNHCRFTYHYDATRTPWRIAMDYIWHGIPEAFLYCNTLTSFTRSIGSENIVDEYSLTGDSLGTFHNNAFIGPFAAGAMATTLMNQLFLDSMYAENVNTFSPRWNYYNSSLKTLTLLVLTGNFINGEVALPVELVNFNSEVNGNIINLNWTTTNEINNHGFEIERKYELENWERTGFKNGAGNSNEPVDYSFTDKISLPGKYSYRLKQIDYNGNYEYHYLSLPVIISKPENSQLLSNFPNPSNHATKFRFTLDRPGNVEIIIYDMMGRSLQKAVSSFLISGYYEYNFDASDLSSGTYFYEMKFDGRRIGMNKMIVLK